MSWLGTSPAVFALTFRSSASSDPRLALDRRLGIDLAARQVGDARLDLRAGAGVEVGDVAYWIFTASQCQTSMSKPSDFWNGTLSRIW